MTTAQGKKRGPSILDRLDRPAQGRPNTSPSILDRLDTPLTITPLSRPPAEPKKAIVSASRASDARQAKFNQNRGVAQTEKKPAQRPAPPTRKNSLNSAPQQRSQAARSPTKQKAPYEKPIRKTSIPREDLADSIKITIVNDKFEPPQQPIHHNQPIAPTLTSPWMMSHERAPIPQSARPQEHPPVMRQSPSYTIPMYQEPLPVPVVAPSASINYDGSLSSRFSLLHQKLEMAADTRSAPPTSAIRKL